MYKFLATVGQKGYIVTARTAFCCEITGEVKAKQIEGGGGKDVSTLCTC